MLVQNVINTSSFIRFISFVSVVHWDVNNEQLHGDFFENKTGDIDILTKILQEVHEQDQDAMLFLNDYQIINRGTMTRVFLHLLCDILLDPITRHRSATHDYSNVGYHRQLSYISGNAS